MPLGEIFKTANDRLKSPFLSSFIFSWIAFNWKAIFVAFAGDENVYTKIDCIESDYLSLNNSLWYPLIIAVLYTIIFPFITVLFQWVTEQARIWSIKLKSKREILKASEGYKIEQKKAGTDDLKELNNQIKELSADLEIKKSEKSQLQKEMSNIKDKKNTLEKNFSNLRDKMVDVKIWFGPDLTNIASRKTYLDAYLDIANRGYISFIEKYGGKIKEEGSVNLKPSERGGDYEYLRKQNALLILDDNDNVHSVKLSQKGEILMKIHTYRYSTN